MLLPSEHGLTPYPSRPAAGLGQSTMPSGSVEITFAPSKRALETFRHGKAADLMDEFKDWPRYDPKTAPGGLIDLSGAENRLMEDWVARYVDDEMRGLQVAACLSYGAMFGSPGLRKNMAAFFNRYFNPRVPIMSDDILATNGVTSLIELVAWTICDPGEAILYLTPTFFMLDYDLSSRTDVITLPVTTSGLADPFGATGADELVQVLEMAANAAELSRVVRCRALVICNPSNPQGRCYASETLQKMADWCTIRGMHLVADEIYAMSQVEAYSDGHLQLDRFSSVLSIPGGHGPLQNVHSLYGMSKDFGMGGLRAGFLVTRNKLLRKAASRVTWFTWVTKFSDLFITQFMSRLDLVNDYLVEYHIRLAAAYNRTMSALNLHRIPFQPGNAGLFIFIDLSQWLRYFRGSHTTMSTTIAARYVPGQPSREIQLCKWLAGGGVFINPGEFAGSDRPGLYRLVFTGHQDAVVQGIKRLCNALNKLESSRSSLA
ncbi:hypothetical protein LCI18_005522 [Fusarium solani-melongenae]|uniref:Uncharacterized protein n=1 Tax=Fusarium solani subsp. cucurbitae TaxID=2747967 RepID=A0ACD3Z056_FUSSC|nr:hypothetical protein LCI18_005522 [Fusarium solani-melongenae]